MARLARLWRDYGVLLRVLGVVWERKGGMRGAALGSLDGAFVLSCARDNV